MTAPALEAGARRFVEAVCAESARLRGDGAPDLPRLREIAERVRAPWRQGGPAVPAQEFRLPSAAGAFRVRIYRPPATPVPAPALVYLHGGGWTLFSIDTHDRLMREYAAQAGIAVVGVDYALAPEHRFPHALDQCLATVDWLRRDAGGLGLDPARLALGGDSAGGNLALAAALALRDAGAATGLRALLLNYGAYDPGMSPQARAELGGSGAMLTADEMDGYWRHYLGDAPEACRDPRARPLLAATLRGLPPACIVVGERDLLREQSLRLHARLADAGVPAALHDCPGAPHSFLEAMSVSPLARRAIADGAAWLRRHLLD